MSQPQQSQPVWNQQFQKHLLIRWNDRHQQWYWSHHDGRNWAFFDWIPQSQSPGQMTGIHRPARQVHMRTDSSQSTATAGLEEQQGGVTKGTYSSIYSHPRQSYDPLDPSFCVRPSTFFEEGRVFSILFTEPASGNTKLPQWYNSNNSNLSQVQHGEYVFTHLRRFIVVKRRREFCFAIPIFSYGNRGTTKPGVDPDEHAIVYSDGHIPQPVQGEVPLKKSPIRVVMTESQHPLANACRAYFGIHHPIQYNVKVKDVGYIHEEDLQRFLSYWRSTHYDGWQPDSEVTQEMNSSTTSITSAPTTRYEFEEVRNPPNFFKMARIFMTPWTEPGGSSGDPFTKTARFVVVKPGHSFSVCLRISTYSGQATTKPGVAAHQHAAIILQGSQVVMHEKGERLSKQPIEIKVEEADIDVSAMSRVNFAKPYTVEHNVKVRRIGRVVGDSVKRLERYFAESLGFTKLPSESP